MNLKMLQLIFFKALGFEVEQLGHRKLGAYPDGILVARPPYDFSIIYDCKNVRGYFPIESDKRALREYVEKFKPRILNKHKHVKRVFSCFIAKSFVQKDGWSDRVKGAEDHTIFML